MKRFLAVLIGVVLASSHLFASPTALAVTPESVLARTPGGQLVLTVSGLDVGVSAAVTVTGPGRYKRIVQAGSGTVTLKGLRRGVYRVAADPVTTRGQTATAIVTPVSARVTARRGGAITVAYPPVPAVSATPKSAWTWDSTLPDGTVAERQTGSITFGQRILTSGQTVNITYESTTTFPSTPGISQDRCFDAGIPPIGGFNLVLEGTVLALDTPLATVGSLALATPMSTTDCIVNGKQARTRTYTGQATFFALPSTVAVNAPLGLVADYASRQNNDPLAAVVHVTGQAVQTAP